MIILALIALLFAAQPSQGDEPETVELCLRLATQADISHKFARERELLMRAEDLDGTQRDEAEVQRRLAVLDWKHHERYDEARERLLAVVEGEAAAMNWLAIARLEFAREDWSAAREAATGAIESEGPKHHHWLGQEAWIHAAVERAGELRLRGESCTSAELNEALERALALIKVKPGYLRPSRLLVRAGLLCDDGESALFGWHQYFHLTSDEAPPAIIADAGRSLRRVLESWNPDAAGDDDRARLVRGLAGTRFHREALLVLRDPRSSKSLRESEEMREIEAYCEYLRDLDELNQAYYRSVARGKARHKLYRREWEQLTLAVAKSTGAEGRAAKHYGRDTLGHLEKRFGLHTRRSGSGARPQNYRVGHAVSETMTEVEQYGERATLRHIVLDDMSSNGYDSWAWETGSMVGGWAGIDAMWQVRPGYVDGPLEAWRIMTDQDGRSTAEEELARLCELDEQRAGEDPYAYLPGLAKRLKIQAGTKIYDELLSQGLEGDALRHAFLTRVEHAVQSYSIHSHEGRHAIDRKLKRPRIAWKLEFTAKCSQVAFAPEPRLAMAGIIAPNIGNDSGHGRANLEYLKGTLSWMKKHRLEIEGLELAQPLLTQLDKLSDDQLRAVARSMDPLAKRGRE